MIICARGCRGCLGWGFELLGVLGFETEALQIWDRGLGALVVLIAVFEPIRQPV